MPTLDGFGTRYLTLTLQMDRLIPGYVDAYHGPADLKAAIATVPAQEPAALLAEAEALRDLIPTAEPARAAYLQATLRAIKTTLQLRTGATLPYLDEVRLLYDITPESIDESRFTAARRRLEEALPGTAPLAERMDAYRRQFQVPAERLPALIDIVRQETRRRTRAIIPLPDDEQIDIVMVGDQPWGAYNWYLGGGRSRVEFNTDIPVDARRLLDLMAHEGYPGHHTEHMLKERQLYHEKGYAEHAVQLLNAPAGVIAEAIATTALEIIFPGDEPHRFNADVLLPAAGLSGDPAQMAAVAHAAGELRYVAGNAAIKYHDGAFTEQQFVDYVIEYGLGTRERAAKNFAFATHPLFRSYLFCYTAGYDLLEAAAGDDKLPLFQRLLTEQLLPSQLAAMANEMP